MGFLDDCIPPEGGCKAAIAAVAVVPPVNWFAGASVRGVRVGVAGYMGAGKSTCARSFEATGAMVIDADAEAKRLMRGSVEILDGLRRAFGDGVVAADSELRVEALGRAAFESVDALRMLNGIVHPRLVGHLGELVDSCVNPLCILDAALIPLWGIEDWFDICVWVDAPFDVRLGRVMAKVGGGAGIDEQEMARRMRMQEGVMGVPGGGGWVIVPDSECREYIKAKVKVNNVKARRRRHPLLPPRYPP